MKSYITALFAAGLAMNGLAESVKLPAPDMDSGLTVMKAIKARHSERAFAAIAPVSVVVAADTSDPIYNGARAAPVVDSNAHAHNGKPLSEVIPAAK